MPNPDLPAFSGGTGGVWAAISGVDRQFTCGSWNEAAKARITVT